METGIIMFLIGACVGAVLCLLLTKRKPIGTLRVIYSEDEPQPYMCLELNTPTQNFEMDEDVLLKVKAEYYSQK